MTTPAKQQCEAEAWSYQGSDTLCCGLEQGHPGLHKTIGLFSNTFTGKEALQVAVFKEQQRGGQ